MKRSRKIVIAGAVALAAVARRRRRSRRLARLGLRPATGSHQRRRRPPRRHAVRPPERLQGRAEGSDRGRRHRGQAHARAGRRDRGQDRRRPGSRLRRHRPRARRPGRPRWPGRAARHPRPEPRRRDDLPRPDRGADPDPAPVRQDARPDRQGAGQDRRRADRQTRHRRDGAAREGSPGRPPDRGAADADPREPEAAGDRHGQRHVRAGDARPLRRAAPQLASGRATSGRARRGRRRRPRCR